MNKNTALAILAAAAAAISSQSAFAQSFTWVPGIPFGGEPPTSIGGYGVSEYVNAGYPGDGGNNQWVLTNPSVDSGYDDYALWLMGEAQNGAFASFGVPSTAVAFAMQGDWNDGFADFYVDGQLIASQDLYLFGEQSLVVSGLIDVPHTLAVFQTGQKNPASEGTHVHILGGAALGASVPDGGSTAALLGGVLALLGTITRRIHK